MQYQRPKQPDKPNPNKKDITKILEVIVKENAKNKEFKNQTFDKLDDVISSQLASGVTFYYFFISIITACIGYTISLTVSNKFFVRDLLLYFAEILWMVSFVLSIKSIHRTNRIISNFNFHILYSKVDKEEESAKHSQIAIDESNKQELKNNPMMYFSIAIFFFMIWYVLKIISN